MWQCEFEPDVQQLFARNQSRNQEKVPTYIMVWQFRYVNDNKKDCLQLTDMDRQMKRVPMFTKFVYEFGSRWKVPRTLAPRWKAPGLKPNLTFYRGLVWVGFSPVTQYLYAWVTLYYITIQYTPIGTLVLANPGLLNRVHWTLWPGLSQADFFYELNMQILVGQKC